MRFNNRLIRTDDMLDALEERLVHHCGDMTAAARDLNVSPASVHFWMEDCPTAAQRLRLAQCIGYQALESAAYQRAVLGVEEDVWFQGNIVGTKRVYSDGLLTQMLKARSPAYRQEQEQGPRVVVNLMPRASTYEEWVGMRSVALKQIEAPLKQVDYADYSPVTESALRDVL